MQFNASVKNGEIKINGLRRLLKRYEGKRVVLTIESASQRRTDAQNRSLHLWYTQLAEKLNESGFDMKKIIRVDIPWSGFTIKNYLWKPLQKVMCKTNTTKKLKREDIDRIFEVLNKVIAERTNDNIHVPFPSKEELLRQMEEEWRQMDHFDRE